MVNTCCVVGCTKRGGRDEGVSFYSAPAIVENQGERTKELSLNWRQSWIAKIHREEWVPTKSSRVNSEHFCLVSAIIIIVYLISEKSAKSAIGSVRSLLATCS